MKFNLDPYDNFSDDELWTALEQAHLGDYVRKQTLGLMMIVAEGGDNFSAGQKQLVCLARALLLKAKVCV